MACPAGCRSRRKRRARITLACQARDPFGGHGSEIPDVPASTGAASDSCSPQCPSARVPGCRRHQLTNSPLSVPLRPPLSREASRAGPGSGCRRCALRRCTVNIVGCFEGPDSSGSRRQRLLRTRPSRCVRPPCLPCSADSSQSGVEVSGWRGTFVRQRLPTGDEAAFCMKRNVPYYIAYDVCHT